jgi:glycogen debranching enzyme
MTLLYEIEKEGVNYALGGKNIFLMANSWGDLSSPLCRYRLLDFGGVWIPGYRITGPCFFGLESKGKIESLKDFPKKTKYFSWGLEITHHRGNRNIDERMFPAENANEAYIHFDFEGFEEDSFVILSGETWLAPAQGYGYLPDKVKIIKTRKALGFTDGIFSGLIKTDREVEFLSPEKFNNLYDRCPSAVSGTQKFGMKCRIKPIFDSLTFCVRAGRGNLRRLERLSGEKQDIRERERKVLNQKKLHYKILMENTPKIEIPDGDLSKAYSAAVVALETLKSKFPDRTEGICAGYPWFAEFWSRDTAWVIPALISVNDFSYAEKLLDQTFRWQSKTTVDVLSMKPGAIPLNFTYILPPFYGGADVPLYYPILVELLEKASGREEYAKRWWRNTERIYKKELHECSKHGGFIGTSPSRTWMTDDTWMDSEDRSVMPVEIQALWIRSLESICFLSPKEKLRKEGWRLISTLRSKFEKLYWNGEDYFYDTITGEGEPDKSVRPNALISLVLGISSKEKGAKAIERIMQEDVLTPWGLRTLSSRDPKYSASLYHSGEVWGVTTGWGSWAAFSVGKKDAGFKLLKIQAERINLEKGMCGECYLGNEPKLYQGCLLQAWSVSTFLSALVNGLFGIKRNALKNSLEITPQIPQAWEMAKIKGIRAGNSKFDINICPSKRKIHVKKFGGEDFRILTGAEERVVTDENGTSLDY